MEFDGHTEYSSGTTAGPYTGAVLIFNAGLNAGNCYIKIYGTSKYMPSFVDSRTSRYVYVGFLNNQKINMYTDTGNTFEVWYWPYK